MCYTLNIQDTRGGGGGGVDITYDVFNSKIPQSHDDRCIEFSNRYVIWNASWQHCDGVAYQIPKGF